MRCRRLCSQVLLLSAPWLSLPCLADEWSGHDKATQFVATAALSTAVTVASTRPVVGFWSGVAAGAAKKAWDRKQVNHEASGKDFIWSLAGAYMGSKGGRWILKRSGGQTIVGYAWRF